MTGYRKYNCDDHFFKQESEEAFYWAGFIAADGCLHISKRNSYQVIINLSVKDHAHVEKFKKSIFAENPVIKTKTHSRISVCSKIMFDDLAKFGIGPRKTHTHKFPEWLANHKLVNHFMRGYFDGDGGFYLSTGGYTHQMTSRICGTISFLNTYRNILINNKISKTPKSYMYNGQGALNYSGNVQNLKLSTFLYDNSTIWLERKYKQHLQLLSLVAYPDKITKEKLIDSYKRLGSCEAVGKELGYNHSSVSLLIKKFGITDIYKYNKRKISVKTGFTKEILINEILTLKSPQLIANKYKCSLSTVYLSAKKFGVNNLFNGRTLNRGVPGALQQEKNG
jgi:hypothetical protein